MAIKKVGIFAAIGLIVASSYAGYNARAAIHPAVTEHLDNARIQAQLGKTSEAASYAGLPYIPSSAPFTPEQRAWLNGYLAGLFSDANLGEPGVVHQAAPAKPSDSDLVTSSPTVENRELAATSDRTRSLPRH